VLVITIFVGPPMSAALGFALAALGSISLALLWFSSRNARVTAAPRRLRVFKGEGAATLLRLESGGRRWLRTGALSLDEVPGLECECRALEPSRPELVLKPVCAGRFELSVIRLDVTDIIGLFVRQEILSLDVVVESLPSSLLVPVRTALASPLAVGENPAGRSGSGQELYAVGQYGPDLETKDILWKRVARMEDESIPVRVREANVRMSVGIGVAISWTSARQRAERIDLVLEAVAQMGRLLLSWGTTLEVTFPLGPSFEKRRAANVVELVDLLMTVSGTSSSVQSTPGSARCDLLVVGPEQLDGLRSRHAASSLPVVVVLEKAQPLVPSLVPPPALPPVLPPGASAFTGTEDLSALSMLVLNR